MDTHGGIVGAHDHVDDDTRRYTMTQLGTADEGCVPD